MRASIPGALRFALVLAAALGAWPTWAQPSQLDELNRRVVNLIGQEKYTEALPMAQEALRLAESTSGPDDESVSWPLKNLAMIYNFEGRYADAEALLERALRIDEKALGPDHRNVAEDHALLDAVQGLLRAMNVEPQPYLPRKGAPPAAASAAAAPAAGAPAAASPAAAAPAAAADQAQAANDASGSGPVQVAFDQPPVASAPSVPEGAAPPPAAQQPPPKSQDGGSLSELGKSRPGKGAKKTTYDFEEDEIEGDLARPDAQTAVPSASSQSKPIVIHETYIQGDESIERYPNIEAPDTVAVGQEIAVQVSLTTEQIAPETKILSGTQHEGKLQLQMAAGENQWTLTVNLTAPGMEFTRGGNTSNITVAREGDSTLAIFYLRPEANAVAAEPRRDTRILATLLHDGAFIARLARPLTIVATMAQPSITGPSPNANAASLRSAPAANLHSAPPQLAVAAVPGTDRGSGPAVQFDPDLYAPDLTIVENRVGNTLRLVFFSPYSAPVEADISDPDALHAWIQSNYAKMARHGRGFTVANDAQQSSPQQAADFVGGFGSELYDRIAPQAFKDLFWKLMDNSRNHAPENKHAKWRFESIQVLSDDPAIPWELMRPVRADGTGRLDFLGLHFLIARWPLGTRGAARPPQSLMVSQSAVIAPDYRGAQQLASAGDELTTLKTIQGFTQVSGNYAAVRDLAMHPPQGIVHFAGHGAVTNDAGVPQFAILLEDSQMDPVTWQSLESPSTASHPLFFFNACDVGESRRFLNDVDGWAPVLLSSGASGYIGALWPVNDATAEAVAASFYRHISGRFSSVGANVAEALAKARADVFSRTSDPTALAYVFYGDPNLIVMSAPGSATQ